MYNAPVERNSGDGGLSLGFYEQIIFSEVSWTIIQTSNCQETRKYKVSKRQSTNPSKNYALS